MPNTEPPEPTFEAPRLEDILENISELRVSFQEGVNNLKRVSQKLRAFQSLQKTNDKELQSVRSTLLSLQRMKI